MCASEDVQATPPLTVQSPLKKRDRVSPDSHAQESQERGPALWGRLKTRECAMTIGQATPPLTS